jgi:hypothetical protein
VELRVIDKAAERRFHGFHVGPETIARDLNAPINAGRNVVNEDASAFGSAGADKPAHDKLAVGIDGGPGPAIAGAVRG